MPPPTSATSATPTDETPDASRRHRVEQIALLSLLIVQLGCASVQPASPTAPVATVSAAPAMSPAPTAPVTPALPRVTTEAAPTSEPASAPAKATGEDSGRVERPEQPDDAGAAIETTRRSVRSTAEWLARGVDSWFGDRPFEDGGEVTDGRASIGLTKREGESPKFSLRFNARFRLPNFERRTYLFFGRDDPRELVTDKPGALSNQDRLLAETREQRSFFAGLGRDLSDSIDLRLGFRRAKPYAQARYREGWEFGERHLVEFRQTFFWTIQDKLGSTTALSWEHAWSSTFAARWLSAATITQDTGKFAWSSILGGYQSFGDRRVLSLEGLVNGEEGTGVGASDYGVQARWSQPLFEKRLIGEFVVGHFWPRESRLTERGAVWALGGNLKMEF